MMAAVPKATVVVTNPTHLCRRAQIRIRQDGGAHLRGKRHGCAGAAHREVAEEPMFRSSKTRRWPARFIASVELDEAVPPEHYKAVAQVIGYVMRLTGRTKH
jgi:flagellar biosynthetic protein FlhB